MKDNLVQRFAVRLSAWFPVLLLATLAMLTYWLDAQVQRGSLGIGQHDKRDPDYFLEDFAATRFGPDGRVVQRLAAKKLIHYPENHPTDLVEPTLIDTPAGKAPM